MISPAMTSGTVVQTILDDRQARRKADRRGIPTIGTGGVLVVAKHFGLITEVRPLLNDLQDAGLYVIDSIYTRLLQPANEF